MYLLFGVGDQSALPPYSTGLQEIGLTRAPLARLIWADAHTHDTLLEEGYWIVPASTLAALCGIQPAQKPKG
ncbi:MAG: hypothetical protein AAF307_10120 [Pseudomonadota bacterium]